MNSKLAEYIWIDGYGGLRSKLKVLGSGEYCVENIPEWNFDGSSTRQGNIEQSEVVLKPVRVYDNPFYPNGYLVMCDTYIYDGDNLRAHQSNQRAKAASVFKYTDYYQPWFGIEQEYYILKNGKAIVNGDLTKPSPHTYCGVGISGRKLAEQHLRACLQAGLKVSGINAEVGPGQWEYQIGPVEGIEAADQLWVSRYILQRIAEDANVEISYHPKPLGDEFPGSGCHVNFSTIKMRMPAGYPEIKRVISKLKDNHSEFVKHCGLDTNRRMTGDHETALMSNFSHGVASRSSSVRIPTDTYNNGCGYFEDRRPSANMDPYKICTLLFEAVIAKP